MNTTDRLRYFGGKTGGGLLIKIDPALDLHTVARAVAPHLPHPSPLVRLRSRHLSASDVAKVDELLRAGRTLLLDARAAPDVASDILERQRRDKTLVGRLCVFDPLSSADIGHRVRESLNFVYVNPGDEVLDAAADPIEVLQIGRAPTGLSFKTLCLLHHRDEGPMQTDRGAHQIFSDAGPVRWQDLQVLLRQQPDAHMLGILAGLRTAGRLTTEQLDLAEAAIFFLRREGPYADERAPSGPVAGSIHELVWSHRPVDGRLYRGQRRSTWHQVPSLLAPLADGTPPDVVEVVRRAGRTQRFIDALAGQEQAWFGRALSDDERMALAQHYGLPTLLLDYSRSFAVAAFFATGAGDPSAPADGDIGIVLGLSAPKVAPVDGLDLTQAAGVRPGRLRVIEPRLPGAEDRIGRQHGVFIEGFASRDLQHLADTALLFRQHAGECFEDERRGITRAALLDPDSRLQQLAGKTGTRWRGTLPLSGTLSTLRLGGDDSLYGPGSWLSSNLGKGQRLVDAITTAADHIDPALAPALRTIIERQFQHAHTLVRTAGHGVPNTLRSDLLGGDAHRLDDVDTALAETAELLGLDTHDFMQRMQGCRPAHRPTSEELTALERRFRDAPADPRLRLALAVSGVVIAFEHLRQVRGALADQILTAAHGLIEPTAG